VKLARNQPAAQSIRHRWLKFNAVGALGVGVQLTLLTVLTSGLGLHYLPATALAVEAAVLHNFFWHEHWTWKDRIRLSRRGVLGRLSRFHLTTGAQSILGNLVFMRLLVGALHLPTLLGNLLTIATGSILNFLLSDRLVFEPTLVQVEKTGCSD